MSNPINININISLTIDKDGNVTVNGSSADVKSDKIDTSDNTRNIMPNDNDRNIIDLGPRTGDPLPDLGTTICSDVSIPAYLANTNSSKLTLTTSGLTNYGGGALSTTPVEGSGTTINETDILSAFGNMIPPEKFKTSMDNDKETRARYYRALESDTIDSTSGVPSSLEKLNKAVEFAITTSKTSGY